MSHQDKLGHTASRFHLQDLVATLRWLLADADFGTIRFRDSCSWTPHSLVFAALLWAWSDARTLTRRAAQARKMVDAMGVQDVTPAGSYQAFLKMLRRWTVPLSQALIAAFRRRMQTSLKQRFRTHGFALFGVDGSRAELPQNRIESAVLLAAEAEKGEETESPRLLPNTRQATPGMPAAKKANNPQLWLTTLFHLGTGLPWSWRLGPSNSSERGHLQEMLADLVAGSLVVADAGFVGYGGWRALLAAGHHFVIRVGANIKLLKELGRYRRKAKKGLVYLWPQEAMDDGLPPLVLRLVTVRDGAETIYLVTTVLATDCLCDAAIREIYRMRWGIELFYRHFKQTYERSKLRSRTAEHVELEATWSLLGLWAMMLKAEVELMALGVAPEKISVSGTLHAFHTAIREYKSPPDPGESLRELLSQAVIDSYTRTSKTSRDYPRKKRRRKIGQPQIEAATDVQIKAARDLKNQQWLRLTA